MKNKKLITILLIIIGVASFAVGTYYQRFIFEMHAIPMQTTIAYIIVGICLVALNFVIPKEKTVLKRICGIWGIVVVVCSIAFPIVFF